MGSSSSQARNDTCGSSFSFRIRRMSLPLFFALYCLEDVRATSELYLKLESTLLMFEQAFREAEERARRRSEPSIVASEMSFLDGIAQSSLALSTSLDQLEVVETSEPPELAGKQQAMVLEKLVTPMIDEDELGNL